MRTSFLQRREWKFSCHRVVDTTDFDLYPSSPALICADNAHLSRALSFFLLHSFLCMCVCDYNYKQRVYTKIYTVHYSLTIVSLLQRIKSLPFQGIERLYIEFHLLSRISATALPLIFDALDFSKLGIC